MKKNILHILIPAVFYSCQEPSKSHEGKSDTVEIAEPFVEISIHEEISTHLNAWVAHWGKMIPGFDLEEFGKNYEGKLPEIQFDLDEENRPGKMMQQMRMPSPDSSLLLDLYSYKIVITEENGEVQGSFNPDSEAAIVDPVRDKKYRLVFTGTAGGIEDGFWISADELVVTGFAELEDGSAPVYWHINLKENSIAQYQYPEAVAYARHAYLKQKFPDIQF